MRFNCRLMTAADAMKAWRKRPDFPLPSAAFTHDSPYAAVVSVLFDKAAAEDPEGKYTIVMHTSLDYIVGLSLTADGV